MTAAALNCVMSGGNGECTGTVIEDLYADCNALCAAGDASAFGDCEPALDCFNNGGDWDSGMCINTGECVFMDGYDGIPSRDECFVITEGDGEPSGCAEQGEHCVVTELTCHDRDLCNEDESLCFLKPGAAGSSGACKTAKKNDTDVIPVALP